METRRKIYNNLFIFGTDFEEEIPIGFEHACQGTTSGNNTATGAANMHQFFNNIVLRVYLEGTKRYDPTAGDGYSDGHRNQNDFLAGWNSRYSAEFSNEMYDYNLFWRPATMNVDPMFKWMLRGAGQTLRTFNSIAEWKANSEFEHSKLSGSKRIAYAPGWNGNSTDSKPTLPSIDNYPTDRFNYRPSATSEVTVATSGSLSGTNWWTSPPSAWGATYFSWTDSGLTIAPNGWKGALDPSGSELPVGVQNP